MKGDKVLQLHDAVDEAVAELLGEFNPDDTEDCVAVATVLTVIATKAARRARLGKEEFVLLAGRCFDGAPMVR